VKITDSLSTMMNVWDRKRIKNPKTQTIRNLMDQQGGKIMLLWVPGHVGIKGYQELTKWIERKHQEEQQEK
jgi:ribonuclease HI